MKSHCHEANLQAIFTNEGDSYYICEYCGMPTNGKFVIIFEEVTNKDAMMIPQNRLKLRKLIIAHEGFSSTAYKDTKGVLTIGYGRNIQDKGVSIDEALFLLDDDLMYFTDKLIGLFEWFPLLDENRQIALIDLCFNTGIAGFCEFKEMIAALEHKDYEQAAIEILNSIAAQNASERYHQLANIIRTGELNVT